MKLLEYISLELLITVLVQSKIWIFLACNTERRMFRFLKRRCGVVFKSTDVGASLQSSNPSSTILRL